LEFTDFVRRHYCIHRSVYRIPVGTRFSAPVQTGPGVHPASCTMGTGSLSWKVKRPERGVHRPPDLAPRLKKEYSYTSTPPVGLHVLLSDTPRLWLPLIIRNNVISIGICQYRLLSILSIFNSVPVKLSFGSHVAGTSNT
jgi:hypothetical protein